MNKPTSRNKEINIKPGHLLNDLRSIIHAAKEYAAQAVNSSLVTLYWQIGRRVRQDILKEKRAEYGKQTVSAVSRELQSEYGQGFSEKTSGTRSASQRFFPKKRSSPRCGEN